MITGNSDRPTISLAEARRNAKARLSAQGRGCANANAERLPKHRGNRQNVPTIQIIKDSQPQLY